MATMPGTVDVTFFVEYERAGNVDTVSFSKAEGQANFVEAIKACGRTYGDAKVIRIWSEIFGIRESLLTNA